MGAAGPRLAGSKRPHATVHAGRSTYPAPAPRPWTGPEGPRTAPSTMPFRHGMALLFAPAKNNEQP
ncbi:hypothetical protein [Streptomyces sp. NPDC001980]|uniref:hypothetical protein n=1 Tax=Streptomyces sp. NPDC001980 TaxID=3157126 RepID=UPI0033173744